MLTKNGLYFQLCSSFWINDISFYKSFVCLAPLDHYLNVVHVHSTEPQIYTNLYKKLGRNTIIL